jgi:thiol-disulfide isomerase/thioredoxin
VLVVQIVLLAGTFLGSRHPGSGRRRMLAAMPRLDVVGGRTVELEELVDGRPAVVNLWQATCRPCADEMPILDAYAREHPEVAVVGVGVLETSATVERFRRSLGVRFPLLVDPDGTWFAAAEGTGIPLSIAVDPSGEIVRVKLGRFQSSADLSAWVDRYLVQPR